MPGTPPSRACELWGGLECTINRVGDQFFSQLAWSGHDQRPQDLVRLAELGLRVLRYPMLWEQLDPDGRGDPTRMRWAFADERLGLLRELGVRPIVGLLHHGSGPRSTSLLDPGFPLAFARFAAAFAQRYPWVEDYTPINEVLTTARFSALYGLWYPHARDDQAFLRAVLHQCQAVAQAMAAIRAVNPAARLLHTEDAGRVYSTPPLQPQADFENQRRWLGADLLCGAVDRAHPLWGYLLRGRLSERELLGFAERPCPPDVLGLNYYLTSDRYLDHRLSLYPERLHGGNGRDRYADVEAVRARDEGIAGHLTILREAAARYLRPVAITEVHLDCHDDEQLRWLWEAWQGAAAAAAQGVDVRAVTTWAALGSFNWRSLLTQDEGHYEPGIFDLRDPGGPRETPLGGLVRAILRGQAGGAADGADGPDGAALHRALAEPGWWRRPERQIYNRRARRDTPMRREVTPCA